MVDTLSTKGTELLDPGSGYSQRLKDEMTKGIGQAGQAQQRAAMLRAARADLGTGASPELLEAQSGTGNAMMEAMGEASGDLATKSPELGLDFLTRALSGETALQGQRLSGFMGQQQLQSAERQAMIRNELERQRMEEEAMMRELALLY